MIRGLAEQNNAEEQDDRLAADTRMLRFLIIDEADRMIENGHFAELESIVRLTQRQGA
jgi:ATP-dependent RNA helicase DDX24/MAK5